MADDDIVFEEPPDAPRSTTRDEWARRLAPLRERKGEWARIFTGAQRQAYNKRHNIVKGLYRGVDAGEFEAVTRPLDDGSEAYGVWARYVGS